MMERIKHESDSDFWLTFERLIREGKIHRVSYAPYNGRPGNGITKVVFDFVNEPVSI